MQPEHKTVGAMLEEIERDKEARRKARTLFSDFVMLTRVYAGGVAGGVSKPNEKGRSDGRME